MNDEELAAPELIAKIRNLEKQISDLQAINGKYRIILKAIKDINSNTDLDTILHKILHHAAMIMEAEMGSILLLDRKDNTLEVKAVYGYAANSMENSRIKVGSGISGWVVMTGKPLLVSDIEKDHRFKKKNQQKYSTKSFISVPLKVGKDILGVLNINDKKSRETFTPENLKILIALTSQSAMIISHYLLKNHS